MITVNELKKLNPCKNRLKHLLKGIGKYTDDTVINDRQLVEINGVNDFMWLALQLDGYRQLACSYLADITEHILHIYEAAIPNDSRPRDCVGALRDYASGLITVKDLRCHAAAAYAAAAAANAANVAANAAAYAAAAAADVAAVAADATNVAAAYAAANAANVAADAAAAAAAYAAEHKWQRQHLLNMLKRWSDGQA